uniref:Ornithine decarboxylase n=1 Tax=Pseudodiaptomus poplesia TaxID=213370 RepID=A0A1S6GL82_9MAXI|nr:ornithine decarboxylase [Pseudodiaptomus poplesia]
MSPAQVGNSQRASARGSMDIPLTLWLSGWTLNTLVQPARTRRFMITNSAETLRTTTRKRSMLVRRPCGSVFPRQAKLVCAPSGTLFSGRTGST